MKYSFLVGLAGAVGLVAACGSDSHPGAFTEAGTAGKADNHAGTHNGGSSSAGTDAAGGDAGGVTDGGGSGGTSGTENMAGESGAPAASGLNVSISSPTAASDPNLDNVLVAPDVTVVCSVSSGDSGKQVDGASVTIEMLDADGAVAEGQDDKPFSVKGTPTTNVDEYSAKFPLLTVQTGVVSFRCSGTSVDKSVKGTATVSSLVDHGPTIVAVEPKQGSAHPLIGIMPVEFTVAPTPLSDDDPGAAVTGVSLFVAGVEYKAPDLVEDAQNPGTWRAQVNFKDGNHFKDPPTEHTSIHIEAKNARQPAPVTAVEDYPIVVDGKGPDIAYVSPKPNAAVHGETVITFTAKDTGAGLDIDTLKLTVTGKPEEKFDATKDSVWTRNGDTFSYRFDALSLQVKSQITVSIRASDLAGNPTDGVTLLIYKDDLPPIVDLDPGMARAEVLAQKECSAAFDPLFAALNDKDQSALAANLFRVLVYEQSNYESGQPFQYIAGADASTARLYVQPDPSQSFLVDRVGNDGICDDIAREDFPYQSITPVKPGGQLNYTLADGGVEPVMGAECVGKSTGTLAPGLCSNKTSDMSYVVKHRIVTGGDEPVVYGIGSLNEPECTGSRWSLSNVTSTTVDGKLVSLSPDGWICLAARVSDKLGNKGISRPFRLCFDDPNIPGQPACWNGGTPAPSCVTSCTPPAAMPPNIYF